jgi:hypothetical protein
MQVTVGLAAVLEFNERPAWPSAQLIIKSSNYEQKMKRNPLAKYPTVQLHPNKFQIKFYNRGFQFCGSSSSILLMG